MNNIYTPPLQHMNRQTIALSLESRDNKPQVAPYNQ